MLIEGSRGFDRGMKLVIWPDQRQGRRRGEQFRIRGGDKQLVGVLRIQYLPGVKRHDLNAPEAARQVRIGKNGIDAGRQRSVFGGLKLGRAYKPQDAENGCAGPPHSWILALGEPEFLYPRPGCTDASLPRARFGFRYSTILRYAAGLPMGPGIPQPGAGETHAGHGRCQRDPRLVLRWRRVLRSRPCG